MYIVRKRKWNLGEGDERMFCLKCIECVLFILVLAIVMWIIDSPVYAQSNTNLLHRAATDRVYAWFRDGIYTKQPPTTQQLCIETTKYWAVFDINTLAMQEFQLMSEDILSRTLSKSFDAPKTQNIPLQYSINIVVDGVVFSAGGRRHLETHAWIIDSGKHMSNVLLENLEFRNDSKQILEGVKGKLEIVFWDDAMYFITDVSVESAVRIDDIYFEINVDRDLVGEMYFDNNFLNLSEAYGQPKDIFRGLHSLTIQSNNNAFGISIVPSLKDGIGVKVFSDNRKTSIQIQPVKEFDHVRNNTWQLGFQLIPTSSSHTMLAQDILKWEMLAWDNSTIVQDPEYPTKSVYDNLRGCFVINLDTWHCFSSYIGETNRLGDQYDNVRVRVNNMSDTERRVRLKFQRLGNYWGIWGGSPFLLDAKGEPTGLYVQVSKNWHGPEWYHAYAIPVLESGQSLDLEMVLAYQWWLGKTTVCMSQLSLQGWREGGYLPGGLWYVMSLGTAESITYNIGSPAYLIADIRPLYQQQMVNHETTYWTSNIGGGKFVNYQEQNGVSTSFEDMKTHISKNGPFLSETQMLMRTKDGRIVGEATVYAWSTEDSTRTLYKLQYEFFDEFKPDDLCLFSLGAEAYQRMVLFDAGNLAWGNSDGLIEELTIRDGKVYRAIDDIVFEEPNTWFAYYNTSPSGGEMFGVGNRALIIRKYKGVFNGKETSKLRARTFIAPDNRSAILELYPVLENDVGFWGRIFGRSAKVQPGDRVELEVELIAYSKDAEHYKGHDPLMRRLLQQGIYEPVAWIARHNAFEIDVKNGRLVSEYPLQLEVDADLEARFVITGGVFNIPVTVTKLPSSLGYALEELVDGNWNIVLPDTEAQANYCSDDDSFELTWVIPFYPDSKEPLIREFRIRPR